MNALPGRSLTLRLAALFGAAAGIALLVLGYVIGAAVDRHFQDIDRDELESKLEVARQALAKVRDPAGLDAVPAFLDAALAGHHGLSVLITTADGQRLFASSGTDFPAPPPELMARPAATPPPLLTWTRGERAWRGIIATVPTGIAGMAPVQVLVAVDIHHHQDFLAAFHTTLWVAVALTLAVIILLGWLAARRGLMPMRQMARVAKGISAEQLHQRIGIDNLPVELVDLAEAFNGMLTRLEESFQRLSHFSSDLAHELRTPVSNLMTQAQVALSRPRSADDYREVLYSSLEEYDRLSRMISDMLFLAKADNGLMVPNREEVDLAREAAELFDFYEALAEEKQIVLRRQGEAILHGDRLMLRRALSNLISNAIRYTPPGSSIEIGLETGTGGTRIWVENPGEPIPPEHLPHLFDRFYRADPSRQKSGEGVGLGLAITRSIVEAHRGRIQVSSANRRTRFEIVFPARPSS